MTVAHHRRVAYALAGLLVLATGVFAVHTVVDLGADHFFNSWLYNVIVAGGGILALWRGLAVREDRAAWLLMGAGLGFWLAGDIYWVVNGGAELPIPSVGDALYLGTYPPFSLAIVLLMRRRIGGFSRMLAVDGTIAAFAV